MREPCARRGADSSASQPPNLVFFFPLTLSSIHLDHVAHTVTKSQEKTSWLHEELHSLAAQQPDWCFFFISHILLLQSRRIFLVSEMRSLLANHLLTLCINLITLLLFTHVSVPAARPYTPKFFTLSYYNPNTGKYAAGYDDVYFMEYLELCFSRASVRVPWIIFLRRLPDAGGCPRRRMPSDLLNKDGC